MERGGTPLKEWNIAINYGIKTGFNDAFIIDGKKKDELIAQDPKSAEIIRPILLGRDVKRYEYEDSGQWVIYVPWHFPLHNDSSINGSSILAENDFKRQYSGIYNHLMKYKIQLSSRNQAETGIRYEWYALQRWGAKYWKDFSKQKIVWGNLCLSAQYALVDEGYYVNAPSPFIVPGNKYILAVLNSKIADWYIRGLGVTRNGGYFEYKPMFVEKLPIPKISESKQKIFSNIVDEILLKKKNKESTSELEKLIDEMTYELYEINITERQYLDNL